MAYITIPEVQAQIQNVPIDDETNPNSQEVTGFITQIEAQMNARFNAAGITVPVTGTDKLNVVKPIAIDGVKAEIYMSIGVELDLAALCRKNFEDHMKLIEKTPAIIQDTSPTVSAPEGSTAGSRVFKREKVQW